MATTTNFGWETPDDTDYVKDGAAAMRTLGNSIDTSMADLKGGTTGQLLSKTSNTDMDFTWVAAGISSNIVDAKGDLIAASADNTPARLAVGTNGQYLTADSSTATGLKWATLPTGKVLQVVSATYGTQVSSTSETYADTGLTANITCSATSSKVLVLVSQSGVGKDGTNNAVKLQLVRNGSSISIIDTVIGYTGATNTTYIGTMSYIYLDSPSSTSALTYKTQFGRTTNSGTSYVQVNSASTSTITLIEIGA